MEFYRTAHCNVDAEEIQQVLSISALPQFCASIYEVINDAGDTGEINTIWGVFVVNREVINGGLRFTLPNCPNTVAWTVTSRLPPNQDSVDVYLTVRRNDNDKDFMESIDDFVDDWKNGLENNYTTTDVL